MNMNAQSCPQTYDCMPKLWDLDSNPKMPEVQGLLNYRKVEFSKKHCLVSPDESKVLHELFSLLSTRSMSSILFNYNHITSLKSRVKHLHPLNFIQVLGTDPELKGKFLKVMARGGQVWNQCFSNFKLAIKEQDGLRNLRPHVSHFSQFTTLSQEQISSILGSDNLTIDEIRDLIQFKLRK